MATKNFKSGSAYKKWLAYGHASGEFKKSPGHQKIKIKGKGKKVKHAGGGYRSKYQLGGSGLPNWLYKARGKAMRKKMQGGGMYADNTVASAGQGVPGSTSNIVFQESDPRLQEQRLASLTAEQDRLQQESITAAEEVKQMEIEGQESILQAAQKAQRQGAMVDTGVKTGMELAKKSGILDEASTTGKGFTTALNVYRAQRAANLAQKAQRGITAGVQTFKQAQAGAKALQLASKAGGSLPVGVAAPQSVGVLAEGAKGTGSALGAGIAQAAKNPNVIAAAANIGGKIISHYAEDDDPTTWTAGEATGDIMSKTGEYAGYGAMIGSVVPGVGNVVGAAAGAVIGAGKATWEGLAGRKKARLAERKFEAKRQAKIDKYDKETRQAFGSQLARVRAGELAQKTYSGYDLGRNVVAQLGGMRMGMPRYGYAV